MRGVVRRSTWTAIATVAALALAPAAAQAALSVVLVGGDALEDRPMTFIATGTTSGTSHIYAKFRPAGGVPCAPSYSADSGAGLFFRDVSGTQKVTQQGEPGAYLLCAYLASSSTAAPSEQFALPVNVRPNNATLALLVPPRAHPGAGVPVTLVGTTELGRTLFAKAKPIGAGPCGQSRAADPATDSFAFSLPASGAFGLPRLAGPFRDVGQYTLCAWLQESSSDAVAEASASAVLNIVPPVPVLTSLDVSPSAFVARPAGGFKTTSFPSTRVSYRLGNTAASVRFTVAVRRVGRRVGSSCRALTRTNRNRKRCLRYQPVSGSYTDPGRQGHNSLRFSGRVGGKRLRTGTYRLYASPRTSTGRGKTLRHTFRITTRR
ncbi:MAG: hypothetical protein Q8O56_08860 [Solirubrobacteraceae bacterium]|nr:hypothetical protein [Solirubrobacteraceae bacterium]